MTVLPVQCAIMFTKRSINTIRSQWWNLSLLSKISYFGKNKSLTALENRMIIPLADRIIWTHNPSLKKLQIKLYRRKEQSQDCCRLKRKDSTTKINEFKPLQIHLTWQRSANRREGQIRPTAICYPVHNLRMFFTFVPDWKRKEWKKKKKKRMFCDKWKLQVKFKFQC